MDRYRANRGPPPGRRASLRKARIMCALEERARRTCVSRLRVRRRKRDERRKVPPRQNWHCPCTLALPRADDHGDEDSDLGCDFPTRATGGASMTILCATDFSPPSRVATRLAASLARRRGETLRLVHAVEPMGVDPAGAMVANAAWEAEMVTTAQQQLEVLAQELRSTGLRVDVCVAQGHAAGVILETARAQETSLIVVGSHGRKGAARLVLGSCADSVVRSARCPVLVARETGADLARWESSSPLRLALAIDGSTATGAVFFWARTAAPTSPENVTLVRVYWPPQEGARYGIDHPWLGNEGHPQLLELIERDLRRDAEAFAGAHVPSARLQVAVRDGGE